MTSTRRAGARPRKVVILTIAPAQLLDIAGPAEVFAQSGRLRYEVDYHLVAARGQRMTTAGLDLRSTRNARELLELDALDTLIVTGGEGARLRANDAKIQRLVRHLASRSRRVAGVCTGAYILAAAGLLDGRRVTTHWRWCADLTKRYPKLQVDPEPIYLHDDRIWTSAGITAGMDLALALLEEDHGHTLALGIARELVLFLRRPGDQKQFSTVLQAQSGATQRLADLLAWMTDHVREPLSAELLAERAGLSPRHFARVFQAETGLTPARFVERLRVEEARRRLESGAGPLASIAAACGFPSEETMRRSFSRQVGASPGEYRDRFRRRVAPPSSPLAAQEVSFS